MNNHLILSCHESDYATMATLLAGMETHSDFVTADMNELWRHEPEKLPQRDTSYTADAMYGPKPARDAWHGFTFPDFPWKTLLSLLESAAWKYAGLLSFHYLCETETYMFTLDDLSRVINKNLLK